MKITAAVVDEKSAPFVLRELELEAPRSDEVLVRIVATGICQSDLHVRDQEYPVPLPAVFGHEGAGVVAAVGATVNSVSPGDHVILSYQACGRCRPCLQGHYSYCERAFEANFGGARLDGSNGLRHNGAGPEVHGHFFGQSSFATYSLATERNVVKVPRDVALELLGPHAFDTLTSEEHDALRLRFGLNGGNALSMKELAPLLGCSRAKAGELVGRAIDKMRVQLLRE